jgi:hypothetical protein
MYYMLFIWKIILNEKFIKRENTHKSQGKFWDQIILPFKVEEHLTQCHLKQGALYARYEIFMVMNIQVAVFWIVTPLWQDTNVLEDVDVLNFRKAAMSSEIFVYDHSTIHSITIH